MKPELLVLAAGMGSRYGGLKQVDPIGPGGEAIIDYSVYDAIRAGFGKVVFVIRKSIEDAFRAKFSNKFEDQIEVGYVFQEVNVPIEGLDAIPEREKPWGTAHAVLVAEHTMTQPFAVINADDYYGISGFYQMAEFLKNQCTADHYSMVGYVLEKTISPNGEVNRGISSMDKDRILTEIVERHKIRRIDGIIHYEEKDGSKGVLQDSDLVSMNFFGFHPGIFPLLRRYFIEFVQENLDNPRAEFYIPLVLNRLVQERTVKVSVLPSDDRWYGVTYQEDKPVVKKAFKKLISNDRYPAPLWG